MNPVERLTEEIENRGFWEKNVNLARKEFLKVQGTVDTNLYFIKEGTLRVYIADQCEEHTVRFGYRNNIIASLDSYVTNDPSDLFIQAIKKSELYIISKERFMSFIWSSEEYLKIWIEVMNRLLYQQMERECDLLVTSPVERYRRVFGRSPQLFQEIPSKYIASYLRMTPETLSRIKKC